MVLNTKELSPPPRAIWQFGDVFAGHNWGGVLLASSTKSPRMLLNIIQRTVWHKVSIVLTVRKKIVWAVNPSCHAEWILLDMRHIPSSSQAVLASSVSVSSSIKWGEWVVPGYIMQARFWATSFHRSSMATGLQLLSPRRRPKDKDLREMVYVRSENGKITKGKCGSQQRVSSEARGR